MKHLIIKNASKIVGLAMLLVSVSVNSACPFATYQEEIPDRAKELRKF